MESTNRGTTRGEMFYQEEVLYNIWLFIIEDENMNSTKERVMHASRMHRENNLGLRYQNIQPKHIKLQEKLEKCNSILINLPHN